MQIFLHRWAAAEAAPSSSKGSKRAQGQGQGSRKRAKAEAALLDDNDYDGLVAGLDGYFGKNQSRKGMHDNASSSRGVLKKVKLLLHWAKDTANLLLLLQAF